MVLEFSKVVTEVDRMGQELAQRTDRQLSSLRAASALLGEFAGQLERLKQVAESPDGQRLRCASPLNEALNLAIPATQPPTTMTLVASDGSQIYPDPHGLAFYFLINVGSIVFRRGSGQAPEVAAEPRLFYAEPEVYPGGRPGMWELMAGHVETIVVDVRAIPIPPEFLGRDYAGDAEFRAAFQEWIAELWRAKDARIAEVLATSRE